MKIMHVYVLTIIFVTTNIMHASQSAASILKKYMRPDSMIEQTVSEEYGFDRDGIVMVKNSLGKTEIKYWEKNALLVQITGCALQPDLLKNIRINCDINESTAIITTSLNEKISDDIRERVYIDCVIHTSKPSIELASDEKGFILGKAKCFGSSNEIGMCRDDLNKLRDKFDKLDEWGSFTNLIKIMSQLDHLDDEDGLIDISTRDELKRSRIEKFKDELNKFKVELNKLAELNKFICGIKSFDTDQSSEIIFKSSSHDSDHVSESEREYLCFHDGKRDELKRSKAESNKLKDELDKSPDEHLDDLYRLDHLSEHQSEHQNDAIINALSFPQAELCKLRAELDNLDDEI